MITPKLIPAKNFAPGYFIREQMEYRNWTQEDLIKASNISKIQLDSVLENNQPLSVELANILGDIFETTSQYWLNLDLNYRINIQ